MLKELICFIETNEKDELIRVSRVSDGTGQFMLLTQGQARMVVNVNELMDAVGAIGHYSTLFDQEQKIRELRKNGPSTGPCQQIYELPVDKKPKQNNEEKEDEGALVLEAQIRNGPTASELALEKQMSLMKGESLVFREKE